MEAKFNFFYGQGFLYFNSSLIIYTEHEYDNELNRYIQSNYDVLSARFAKNNKTFLYIPRLSDIIGNCSLTYLTGRHDFNIINPGNTKEALKSILPFYVFEQLPYPSLTFFGKTDVNGFRLDIFNTPEDAFNAYFEEIEPSQSLSVRFSVEADEENVHRENTIRFSRKHFDEVDTAQLNQEINDQGDKSLHKLSKEDKELIEQARENVRQLLSKGLSIDLIYSLIEPQIKPSRLLITKDYRIFLTDYDNQEIKLNPIDKTVFFFYLRHPEGVNFKDLIDHKDELKKIYKKVTNRMFNLFSPINSLVDVTNNSINEKCSHIRRVFLANIAVPLANEYYIIGKRGDDKRIQLDRELLTWECDF